MNDASDTQPRTIGKGGKRLWVYPTEISGKFQALRTTTAVVLLALFFATPWMTLNGNPLVRLSLLSDHYYVLGKPLVIYDFYHFVFLFLLLVLTLFLSSALFGRIWCGYACPQTIFIEHIYRRIETWIEGNAQHRKVADQHKSGRLYYPKKILKQILFFIVALAFSANLVALFTGVEYIVQPTIKVGIAVTILTALAWFDGAYWREQFCHIVCPYARFQSVLQDRNSITIGYDPLRGEPRKKGKNRDGAGDCIDCGLCVRVCPSAIDIREGATQLECIACARCVDACDSIMTSIQKPTGLIRYDQELNFSQTARGELPPKNNKLWLVRPRILMYGAVWLVLFGFGVERFIHRSEMHVRLLNASALPYVVDGDRIKNIYTVRISNQSESPQRYSVAIASSFSDVFKLESPATTQDVQPGDQVALPVLVSATKESTAAEVQLEVSSQTGVIQTVSKAFIRPK